MQKLFILIGLTLTIITSSSGSNTHGIWRPELVSCDPKTNICETLVNANLTFNSSSMEIMFGDAENQYPHAFFDEISLRYLLQGSDPYLLYDGELKESTNCGCVDELDSSEFIEVSLCSNSKDDGTTSGFRSNVLVDSQDILCPPMNKGMCCHSLWLEDVHTFSVFRNLTCKFDDMQFIYKKKLYQLTFSQRQVELVDMNITWMGGEQWTFPTDTFALLEDLDTGEVKFTFLSSINLPSESDFLKAGWWHSSEMTTSWMASQQDVKSSFNKHFPRVDAIEINNRDIKAIECEQVAGIDESNISSYSMLVKRTRIMGENGRILDYAPGSTGNVTILISGYPVRLCVNYPTICLCLNSDPLQCLEYQGFISIRDYSSNTYKLGFLNNTAVYRTPICSGSDFYLMRTPHNIQINIQSNNLIPRYFMSDCQPQWQHLGQNISILCNCTFLPCEIQNDLGTKTVINLMNEPQYLLWENNSEWFELTCGNFSQKIDRFATIYAPFKTSIDEEEEEDWMQSAVFNILFFGYDPGLTLLFWAILSGITFLFYRTIGRTFTIIIWCIFLIFYWIGGFIFLLFIVLSIIGFICCLPVLNTIHRARAVASVVKDVYEATAA